MPSTRVLLEAQAHQRRRVLLAALVADPGGGDRDLPGTGPLVGGLVVAAGLLVGALVWGLVAPAPSRGWDDGRLVVARSSGARFVSLGGSLRPVLNGTSARLLLPAAADRQVQVVDDAAIAAAPHGPALGIPGAPDDLPTSSSLLGAGWMACLLGSRVLTTISSRPSPARDEGAALTARLVDGDGGGHGVAGYLLVSGRAYALPTGREEAVSRFLGVSAPPVTAPRRWVDLFTTGTALDLRAFRFPSGSPLGRGLPPGVTAAGKAQQVGQLLTDVDHSGVMSVVLADGTVPLTPFAAAVYRATATGGLGEPRVVHDADLAETPISATRDFTPGDWPRTVPTASSSGQLSAGQASAGQGSTSLPCARLDADGPRSTRTELVTAPAGPPWVRPPGAPDTVVEDGRGALVRSAPEKAAPDRDRVVLIDSGGTACPVVDPTADTVARLGYPAVPPVFVAPAWLALFRPGPALSTGAAGLRWEAPTG